jgi:putative membrane protein
VLPRPQRNHRLRGAFASIRPIEVVDLSTMELFMKTLATVIAGVLCVVSSAGAEDLSNAEFAKKAGAAGLAEVHMGKLGGQKASNAEVKAFAEKMVADHSKANKELAALAKSKGLEVPAEPDLMHKGMMEKFEHQKADADFNHDYMQQMVRDHEKAVELFKSAAAEDELDPEVRAWAKKTLPTLQGHLKDAQTLEGKLDK